MISPMKSVLKRAAAMIVSEYRINLIYACDQVAHNPVGDGVVRVDEAICRALEQSPSVQVRKAARYFRKGMQGMAVLDGQRPVCVAHFADVGEYDRAATWPMRAGELALMDIVTETDARGKGHGERLLLAATPAFLNAGYTRLIAFIWWTNTPSIRLFEKAGWCRIGFSVEVRRGDRWWVWHRNLGGRR